MILLERPDMDEVRRKIRECTREAYEERLPAVLDNFRRVQEYVNMQDYLYEKYLAN